MHENGYIRPSRRLRLRAFGVIAVLIGALALGLRALLPLTAEAGSLVIGHGTDELVLREVVVATAYAFANVAALALTLGGMATALSAAGLGSGSRTVAGCVRLTPTVVRRVVLAGCGTAMTLPLVVSPGQAAVPSPDHAWTDSRFGADLSGLALPDLPTAPRAGHADSRRHSPKLLVQPGDSLWSIAADLLGRDATPAQIATQVDQLHARNLRQIGADPDLILPGTELTLWRNS